MVHGPFAPKSNILIQLNGRQQRKESEQLSTFAPKIMLEIYLF